jgi:hypothetical protein
VVTVGVLAAFYLRWTPLAPDLAAQVARANVVRQVGSSSWWTGWFGGLSLPSYSVLVPSSMAVLGVRATGLLATGLGAIGSARLVRDCRRPRAGAFAFAVSGMADLVDGRITFVVGVCGAVWSLVALQSRRTALCVVLSAAAYFGSPLAALFLGIVLVAIAGVDRSRRRSSAIAAGTLLVIGGAMAVLFPGTGTMPFAWLSAVPAALGCVVVIAVCTQPVVRVSASLVLASFPLFMIIPGAIGSNATRLVWIGAAPVVLACAPLSRRWLVPAVVLLAVWPAADTVGQLRSGSGPSTHARYYTQLSAELAAQRGRLGAAAVGERVEVVDTSNHWASVYLSDQSLARGWDRQADRQNNPIFYEPGLLTASSYRQWLDQLAVGWVALPSASLDYASVAEAKLVRSGLSYLTAVWSDADWTLYRMSDPSPLAVGAVVRSVTPASVVFTSAGPGVVRLRLRWSDYLTVVDPATNQSVPACVLDAAGWTNVYLPGAATVALTSNFAVSTRLQREDPDCVRDVSTP